MTHDTINLTLNFTHLSLPLHKLRHWVQRHRVHNRSLHKLTSLRPFMLARPVQTRTLTLSRNKHMTHGRVSHDRNRCLLHRQLHLEDSKLHQCPLDGEMLKVMPRRGNPLLSNSRARQEFRSPAMQQERLRETFQTASQTRNSNFWVTRTQWARRASR